MKRIQRKLCLPDTFNIEEEKSRPLLNFIFAKRIISFIAQFPPLYNPKSADIARIRLPYTKFSPGRQWSIIHSSAAGTAHIKTVEEQILPEVPFSARVICHREIRVQLSSAPPLSSTGLPTQSNKPRRIQKLQQWLQSQN